MTTTAASLYASTTPFPAELLFDPTDPDFRADPYPRYTRIRREAPVHWSPVGSGGWVTASYRDCRAVLRDPRLGMARSGGSVPPELGEGAAARIFRHLLIFNDPPHHTRLRRLVGSAFTPRTIDALRPRVEAIVNQLLNAALERGEMDLMSDFAFELPVRVICELLGVPSEDRVAFRRWTPDFSRIFEPALQSADELARCNDATQALVDYFERLVETRRRRPGDDLLSDLIAARDQGDALSHDELIAMSVQLLNAGYETTMGLIGNAALALLRHRDQLAKLRADPALVHGTVEECLRFDSPVQLSARIAHEEIELRGARIQPDEIIWVLISSANRDPDAFDQPDRFDVERSGPPHLAFGSGAHFCLGAHLARMEGTVALGALARRLPRLELTSDALVRRPSFLFRTLEQLPVRC